MVLVGCAAGVAFVTRPRDLLPRAEENPSDTISIAIVGVPDSARPLGIRLGLEEAERTAQLIGFHLDVRDDAADEEAAESADVVILTGTYSGSTPSPESYAALIDARSEAPAADCARSSLRVLPSAAERAQLAAESEGSRVVAWHPSLHRYGAEQLNRRFLDRFGVPMDEAAWSGWFAVKAGVELTLARRESPGAQGFDGHKGVRLTFDDRGRLRQPLYRLLPGGGADSTVEPIPMTEVAEGADACR